MTTIFQHPLLTDFLYPFLLMFFIVFALLEKTKILGEKHQLNAFLSLVIGLVFVSVVFPRIMVTNLILFLAVGLVVIFVGLMLWGFISGEGTLTGSKGMKIFLAILVFVALVLAVIGFSGFGGGIENFFTSIFNFLFNSSWSGGVWTNILMIVLIVGAIFVAIGIKVKTSGS